MSRLFLIAAALVALVLPSFAAGATAESSAPFAARPVVATSPQTQMSSSWAITGLTANTLCFGDGPLCPSVWAPTLQFGPITSDLIGTTVWTDTSTSVFADAVAAMTDGVDGRAYWNIGVGPNAYGGFSWWGIGRWESDFFVNKAGPTTGVDLAGYTIDGVGFRIDSAVFSDSGWSAGGQFVFTGTAPRFGVCLAGGWKTLYGENGSTFRNEGDCVQFAITGK